MPRLTLAAVPLLAGLLPLSAGALGLGEISLRSALNQPLDAVIPLTGDSADELRQVQVRLASPDVFQRFGLDRPSFLNDLVFQVQADGTQGVVRVSSPRAVSEPFVSLLLEVTWPAGRLLREYTVLLDPPAFAQPAPAPQVAAPADAGSGSVVSRPAPAPAATPAPAAEAPAAALAPGQPSAQASTQESTRESTRESTQESPQSSQSAAPGTYGPVRPSETLWAIAQSVRPDDATTNQMMVALFRANPEAFAGNINRLRAGAILRVPAPDELASLAGPNATAEVRRQNEEWRQGTAATTGAGGDSPRLQLVPPAEEAAGAPATDAAPAAASGGDARLAAELAESRRLLELRNQELKVLQDRLSALEGSGPAPGPGTPGAGEGVADAATDAAIDEAADEAAVERLPDEVEPLPGTVAGADAASDADTASEALATGEPAATGRAAARRPAATTPAETGGSFLGSIGNLVLNAWFLGAAALVLLGSLFLFRRRSAAGGDADATDIRDLRYAADPFGREADRGREPDDGALPAAGRDSFIVEEESGDAGDRTAIAPAPRLPIPRGDGEQPLEKTISADSGMEIDQADVVAEADFHMAYGLYDQAADLLGKALRNDPSRRDLRLKLLEVLFIWENKGAFLKEARTFHEQLQGSSDPDWNKVLIMGKQLCPEDALFAGAATAGSADSLDFSLDDAGRSADVDIPFDEAAAGTAVDLDVPAPGAGDSLDFDLGDSDSGATQSTTSLNTGMSPTVEAPTLETPTIETPTVETPTIESESLGSPTVESPTLESTGLDWPGQAGRSTGEPASQSSDQTSDQGPDSTEEINLEDLGLDLTGLDEAAGDLAGTTNLGPGPDFDVGENLGDGSPSSLLQEPTGDLAGPDSTAELPGMGLDEGTLDLPAFGTALEKSGNQGRAGEDATADTAEHRALDDTAEQPRADMSQAGDSDAGSLDLDLDLGAEPEQEEVEPTAIVSGRRGPEGPTMTEVGTKLDLARAYIDMGDPDGARSILNEVLEEGDGPQQQEARKLLDELAD